MMISKINDTQAFVWIWLPGEIEPIICGKLIIDGDYIRFAYGKSYLERISLPKPAISIYKPELPLKKGHLPLLKGLTMPGCIRDASPDAWGRRVIINKMLGLKGADTGTTQLNELTYLLESGSDRIGALDFQRSSETYCPRLASHATLEELLVSADKIERWIALTPALDQALLQGSSIGGARPKALIEDHDKKYIAKFSSSNDLYNIVKSEYIAMKLADLAGLNVAPVKLVRAANKDILLIERFDREKTNSDWSRHLMVSALTLFGLDEMTARYASYETLAEIIRHDFTEPKQTLKELFSRLVFNILCGNTDDHARNHAAFWDGKQLSITPAYDICPQHRSGNEASQAMLIFGNNNLSQLKTCLATAHNFLLTIDEAKTIFTQQQTVIEDNWHTICDEANLSNIDRKLFWRRQFLNPYSMIVE